MSRCQAREESEEEVKACDRDRQRLSKLHFD